MSVDPSEILNAHLKNKKDTIIFFKELGNMNPNPISPNIIKVDTDSTSLLEAEGLFEKKLIEFSKSTKKEVVAVARFCLALFLI